MSSISAQCTLLELYIKPGHVHTLQEIFHIATDTFSYGSYKRRWRCLLAVENVKAQESSSSRSSTVQPRYLIGVQHAPQSIGGLFSELFDFELVRVIEEDQEGSMENDNEISGKKFSNSVRENISLSDRVVKLKDTLVVEDCAGLSQDIIKLYSWRKEDLIVEEKHLHIMVCPMGQGQTNINSAVPKPLYFE
ncbi:hypothetical protein QL285_059063 [Trifolium repens]|nr:hypothetical protein QL285_059063 [Trifolium repens]